MGVDMCKTTFIVPFLWKKWNEKLVNNSIITQNFSKIMHVLIFGQKQAKTSYQRQFTKNRFLPERKDI